MASTKPPVFKIAATAWGDAFRALGAMPVVAGAASAVILASSLLSFAIGFDPNAVARNAWFSAAMYGLALLDAVLLAPLAIAVHRFVLLGETTRGYVLDLSGRRFRRFVSFALLVKILLMLPSAVEELAKSVLPEDSVIAAALGFAGFIMVVVVAVIAVRRAILFPAIAVDAPGASWSHARLDTLDSSWRVAFAFILTMLPVAVVGSPVYFLLNLQALPGAAAILAISLYSAAVQVATLAAVAAAASRLYRARADVMTRPDLSGSAAMQPG